MPRRCASASKQTALDHVVAAPVACSTWVSAEAPAATVAAPSPPSSTVRPGQREHGPTQGRLVALTAQRFDDQPHQQRARQVREHAVVQLHVRQRVAAEGQRAERIAVRKALARPAGAERLNGGTGKRHGEDHASRDFDDAPEEVLARPSRRVGRAVARAR